MESEERSAPKIWLMLVLANTGALAGIVASLFILPGSSPFWLWATTSLSVLALINCATVLRLKRGSQDRASPSKMTNVIVGIGFLLFLADLIYGIAHH
jgi:4-hydroxybenzoate polyprenyltransferase